MQILSLVLDIFFLKVGVYSLSVFSITFLASKLLVDGKFNKTEQVSIYLFILFFSLYSFLYITEHSIRNRLSMSLPDKVDLIEKKELKEKENLNKEVKEKINKESTQ